jgi:HSP20 family protein
MVKESKKKEGELERVEPSRALSPFEEMDRYFNHMMSDFIGRGWLRPMGWERPWLSGFESLADFRAPRVDVINRDDDVLVRAEIPGVDKNDLEVSVSEDSVTIKGETKREEKESKGDYFRSEISRGSFARTVGLPSFVNADEAKASFKDGVLELTLPKVEKAKRRTIDID